MTPDATGKIDFEALETAVRRSVLALAKRRVVLGDGALWIWRIADEQFPGAIQIVNLFHAKEHLWTVAKALYPDNSERLDTWADASCAELEQGRLDDLLCAEYIARNRNRMRYADFRAADLCVGSGVVEAGCCISLCFGKILQIIPMEGRGIFWINSLLQERVTVASLTETYGSTGPLPSLNSLLQ